jgi:hypothetical protein
MVNVLPFLSSVQTTVQKTTPLEHFAEMLFHELMHHYVAPVNASSALRKKYATEDPVVISHLHVMALEKFALLKLGKTDELKLVDEVYRTNPAAVHYKRAWQIVNDVEGYEAFVKELKLLRK